MTEQEKKAFTDWHEQRLVECQYPEAIVQELRTARIKWLGPYAMVNGAPQ